MFGKDESTKCIQIIHSTPGLSTVNEMNVEGSHAQCFMFILGSGGKECKRFLLM